MDPYTLSLDTADAGVGLAMSKDLQLKTVFTAPQFSLSDGKKAFA